MSQLSLCKVGTITVRLAIKVMFSAMTVKLRWAMSEHLNLPDALLKCSAKWTQAPLALFFRKPWIWFRYSSEYFFFFLHIHKGRAALVFILIFSKKLSTRGYRSGTKTSRIYIPSFFQTKGTKQISLLGNGFIVLKKTQRVSRVINIHCLSSWRKGVFTAS